MIEEGEEIIINDDEEKIDDEGKEWIKFLGMPCWCQRDDLKSDVFIIPEHNKKNFFVNKYVKNACDIIVKKLYGIFDKSHIDEKYEREEREEYEIMKEENVNIKKKNKKIKKKYKILLEKCRNNNIDLSDLEEESEEESLSEEKDNDVIKEEESSSEEEKKDEKKENLKNEKKRDLCNDLEEPMDLDE